jgi:hypothetical protein
MKGYKGGIYRLRKAKGATNSSEKQQMSGTIGAYVRYSLHSGPKCVAYV